MGVRQAVVVAGLAATGLAGATASAAGPPCGVLDACEVEGGSYRVSPPAGWDGVETLPAALFLHGYQGSAEAGMGDDSLRRGFSEAGVLLILPDGLGGTWAHQGSPSRARDDIAFLARVRADLLARWPVDPGRLWATGFSQGGSMVWDLACRGGGFVAYVAISGAFWEPQPDECPAGPMRLLHWRGLADGTVPLEGRTIRATFKQGDVFEGFRRLRAVDGCRAWPDRYDQTGTVTWRFWDTSCTTGQPLAMAIHPGGHELPEGWIAASWAWVQAATGAPR